MSRLWAGAREFIEGQDPLDRGKIADVLRRRFYWPQRVLGAVDYGLWDIAGKAFNQPIYKLLGATRERVRAYGSTIHHSTDERFIETVLACRERGLTAVKLHPYCNFEDDLRLVYKVRKAVGDEMRLMIDTLVYPAPYTRDQAMRMGRALDELNFWWFEDPLPKTDLDGLADLTRECRVVQIRAAGRVEHISEYAARRHQLRIARSTGANGYLMAAHCRSKASTGPRSGNRCLKGPRCAARDASCETGAARPACFALPCSSWRRLQRQ